MSEADDDDMQPLATTPATSGTTQHNPKRSQMVTDEDALAWLRGRRRVETTKMALAREWGWDDMKVHRRLIKWSNERLLTFSPAADGKRQDIRWIGDDENAAVSISPASHEASHSEGEILTSASQPGEKVGEDEPGEPQNSSVRSIEKGCEKLARGVTAPFSTPLLLSDLMGQNEKGGSHPLIPSEKVGEKGETTLPGPSHTSGKVVPFRRRDPVSNLAEEINARAEELRPIFEQAVQPTPQSDPGLIARRLFGAVLICLGAALAYHALHINWVYGASLGEDGILAGLGLTSDAVALAMPTAWLILGRLGARKEARRARAIWCLTILWAAMSTLGFTALSVERSTAGTDQAATRYAAIRSGLERLQRERDAIRETRSVAALAQAVTVALADVPGGIVKSSSGCTDATAPSSIRACEAVLKLRQAQETARHRDALDVRLTAERQALTEAPAVRSADPLPERLATLVNWLFRGWTGVTAHDVEMARLLVLALLPHVAGLILEMAAAVWARRRVAEG